MIVDGKEVQTEAPPQIIDGSTMIPARGLAEALGARVEWDEANKAVVVTSEAYGKFAAAELGDLQAKELLAAAQSAYWHVANGGTIPEGPVQAFVPEGEKTEYRWLGSDIDTKTKYADYLKKVFTAGQVDDFINSQLKSKALLEIDGKLAQPDADGGSAYRWGESAITLTKDEGVRRTYKAIVPEGDKPGKKSDVQLLYVRGAGWRVDAFVSMFR
nr:DL-endopeptidase inhibitor IseA family protein [Paenibacillus hamazuiensis]